MTDDPTPPETSAPKARIRRPLWPKTLHGWLRVAMAAGGLFLVMTFLVGRYGVLTPQARMMIEAGANGLKLGSLGRLRISGVEGDIWRHFTIRRLTISDQTGVWLEADHLAVQWRYEALVRRRLVVDDLSARQVRILRRPVLEKSAGASSALPVSILLKKATARVETLPAFSDVHGLFDLTAHLNINRRGGESGQVGLRSVTRPSDFLATDFNIRRSGPLSVKADAVEARGGAIAGALGLASDRPFRLTARVWGAVSRGQLQIQALTGQDAIVQAQGAWTPAGGAISARVKLAASRLTRDWVRRLGPEATLILIGSRPANRGPVDLDARLISPNVVLTAKGPADLDHQRTAGMRAQLSVGDLTRIFSVPKMAQGHATGLLSGSLDDIRINGDVAVTGLTWDNFHLARTAGPATLSYRGGELDIRGDLAGSGGSGKGWLADAAGPAPHARIDFAWLKNGQLLIRSLDAVGRGLKLQASGGRELFGGINFKGQLQIANLGQTRRGAGGSAAARWSAVQRSDAAPWQFTLDATGAHFASGYSELDRLLGPSPVLKLQASLSNGRLEVSSGALTGAAARARGHGVRAADGQLNYDLDWQASGPFAVGPVSIVGKAEGKGTIVGPDTAARVTLTTDFDRLDFPGLALHPGHLAMAFVNGPAGLQGGLGVTGDSDYGPSRAQASFRFVAGGADLQDIDANAAGVRLLGALSLRNNMPSTANLTLAVGPGAVLTQGQLGGSVKIVDAPGGPVAALRLTGAHAVLRGAAVVFDKLNLTGDGPLDRFPYQAVAEGRWNRTPLKLNGSGVYSRIGARTQLSFSGGGRVRKVDFNTVDPLIWGFGGGEQSAHLNVALGGGRARLDLKEGPQGLDAKGEMDKVDVSVLSEDFQGQVDADLTLHGRGADLAGALEARLKDARGRDAAKGVTMDGNIRADLAANHITIEATAIGAQGLKSNANLILPAAASAAPFHLAIVRDRPMQGHFAASGELQPLWDLFFGGERTLGGAVDTEVSLAGTLGDPRITGRASLANGRFEDYATGLKLKGLTIQTTLQSDVVTVSQFSGADGAGGTLSGSGQASLARGGGSTFTLGLHGFRLIDNDTAKANATGDVKVTRNADGRANIQGTLTIDRADVNAATRLSSGVATMDVIERNLPADSDLRQAPPQASGPGVGLDVALNASRRVMVKGRGLDLEMSLSARVTGTTTNPILDGTARIVRGAYEFAGKRFEFDDKGVVYLASQPRNVRLDLSATRVDPSLTAVIRIKGTAEKPEITLTSTPVLPNDEVLSQVLFGQSASQLSPLEAAQLASALTSLATGGGFDVIGGLRAFAGLDRLAVAGGGATPVTLAGGKYLTDNVYLELGGGGREGTSAQVEYRVNRSLSFVSKLASVGGAKLSVRWRHDFGRPKKAH